MSSEKSRGPATWFRWLGVFVVLTAGGLIVEAVLSRGVDAVSGEDDLIVDTVYNLAGSVVTDTESRSTVERMVQQGSELADGFVPAVGPDGYPVTWQFVVGGGRDNAVVLTGVSARDVRCLDAETRGWVRALTPGGGPLEALGLDFELSTKPLVQGVPDIQHHIEREGDPWEFPRQVSRAESENFVASFDAPADEICEFDLVFEYLSGGEEATQRLDRRFRVAGELVGSSDVVSPY